MRAIRALEESEVLEPEEVKRVAPRRILGDGYRQGYGMRQRDALIPSVKDYRTHKCFLFKE